MSQHHHRTAAAAAAAAVVVVVGEKEWEEAVFNMFNLNLF